MKKYIGIKSIQAEPQDRDGQPGYKVVYEDGYTSWSPKDVFDKAYISDQTMSFGFALEAMKMGFRVKRPKFKQDTDIGIKGGKIALRDGEQSNILFGLDDTDLYACDWMICREEVKETTE